MEKTWRWFGRNDKITLPMLRQFGVEGVVTALHHIPNGEIWPYEEICELKGYIEGFGLKWSVVESLPVSEEIKYAGPRREQLLANYRESIINLGRAGIKTICYNFMPVIDWIRTDLNRELPDGTRTLYFDHIRFAYFDCEILKRDGAYREYSPETIAGIMTLKETITEQEKEDLIDTIIIKTQGFVNGNFSESDNNPVDMFRHLLSLYKGIGRKQLRENLRYFLQQIMPSCQKAGVNMCIHPDDPPFAVLGLPRIVTNKEDIRWILQSVDTPFNGLTFCAGSLSAGSSNDVAEMAREFASRTHFVHLRSTDILNGTDFVEASHLHGRGQLTEVIRAFYKINPDVPMRVDHGRLMLDDAEKGYNPGYSLIGRMFAFGQIGGMITVIEDETNKDRAESHPPESEEDLLHKNIVLN